MNIWWKLCKTWHHMLCKFMKRETPLLCEGRGKCVILKVAGSKAVRSGDESESDDAVSSPLRQIGSADWISPRAKTIPLTIGLLIVIPRPFPQFEFPDLHMGNCVVKNQKDDDSDNQVEFSGGNVHLVTTKESWDQKLAESSRDGKIVIANFSATWCGPCRMVAPFYIELSEKYPSLMFLLVDVDELSDFSSSWDIKATPTFFFLKNGEQIGRLVGANKPELQKKITAIVDSAQPQ
ncbi:PREDICTED: thioredoxin H9-like [Tarenaya hassleriana]|uniref:thioredoxin H9-like n=1 Tax=Tarenaya hassleriana TaxID=28532 RepID=UPI00053C4A49|nr:PREDICTED: thioredoxin H9-like [Tarenaya hassleriana]